MSEFCWLSLAKIHSASMQTREFPLSQEQGHAWPAHIYGKHEHHNSSGTLPHEPHQTSLILRPRRWPPKRLVDEQPDGGNVHSDIARQLNE